MKNAQELIQETDFDKPYDLIQDTVDFIKPLVKEFESQISIGLNQEGTTRFANNQITQHTDLQTLTLQLKLAKGKRLSSSLSTNFTKENLEVFIKNAIMRLDSVPEVDFYQGLPDPVAGTYVDCSGKSWSPEERVQIIRDAVDGLGKNADLVKLAGTATEEYRYSRTVSSNGIDVEDASQINYFKVNAIADKSHDRGYGQEEIYWRLNEPDYTAMTEEAVKTAIDTIKFADLPAPKDYEVLFAPSAVSNLLTYVLFGINPVDFHEGNSYTADRIGDQIFDKKFSIDNLSRDPAKATLVGSFDGEGIPTRNSKVIEKGVLKYIPYNSFYASKFLQDKNLVTGNDLALFGFMNFPIPASAVVATGSKSFEDQIQDVDDGLLVKTFWYNRFTIKKEGGLTGLTRNGLYHVKNGEIIGAVRNLRYTESFLKAFGEGNIISVGDTARSDDALAAVPSMHLKSFHFSSVAHKID